MEHKLKGYQYSNQVADWTLSSQKENKTKIMWLLL